MLRCLFTTKRYKISYVRGTIKDRTWIPRVCDKKIPVMLLSTNKVINVPRGKAMYDLFPNNKAVPASKSMINNQGDAVQDSAEDSRADTYSIKISGETCSTDESYLKRPIHIYQILQHLSNSSIDIPLNDIKTINGAPLSQSSLYFDKVGTYTLGVDVNQQKQFDITLEITGDKS